MSKINSSFFDNIMNNSMQKKSRIKELLINISRKKNQIILKNYFLKWSTLENEIISNELDNSLELNKDNNILNNIKAEADEVKDEIQKYDEKEIQLSNNNINKEIKSDKNIFTLNDDIIYSNSININDKENNKKDIFEEIKENKLND